MFEAELINNYWGGWTLPPEAEWLASIDAGLSEEILVVAIPVTVMRWRRSTGAGGIRDCCCLLIAGHALFSLRYLLFGDVGIYVYFLLALVALGIVFALDRHWYRRPPTHTRSVGPRPPRVAVSSPQPEADGGLG